MFLKENSEKLLLENDFDAATPKEAFEPSAEGLDTTNHLPEESWLLYPVEEQLPLLKESAIVTPMKCS